MLGLRLQQRIHLEPQIQFILGRFQRLEMTFIQPFGQGRQISRNYAIFFLS